MPIIVKCSCGKSLRIDERHIGKKIKCPTCGNLVGDAVQTAIKGSKPNAPLSTSVNAVTPKKPNVKIAPGDNSNEIVEDAAEYEEVPPKSKKDKSGKKDRRSHWLIPEDGSKKDSMRLRWDDKLLFIFDANDELVFEAEIATAHRAIDLSRSFVDGVIGFVGPKGTLTFKQNNAALADLQKLIEIGLQSDPEYRAGMRAKALRALILGPIMFLVAGGIFAGFCWYASWAPEPPEDSWMRLFGGLIKLSLVVLLAVALIGLVGTFAGLHQWRQIRRIERTIDQS